MIMKDPLLADEVQSFITEHLGTDINALLLKKPYFKTVTNRQLAEQIKGRRVAEYKFPYLNREGIWFPPQINLEQTSSQYTAEFKAQGLSGQRFLDLTCGFGIDAFFLSKGFQEVFLVEQNPELLEQVQHNWEILGRRAHFINQNLHHYLADSLTHFDLIYLDPARRDHQQKKVFLLEDLSPNIIELQEVLLQKGTKVLTKLSPLIDLKYLTSVLRNIERIDIIAVKNEVKEIVVHQRTEGSPESILCRCINLETTEPVFEFYLGQVPVQGVTYSAPKRYLYIPNNAIIKSGAYVDLALRYSLSKLHPNTHLFTSEEQLENFPGRILEMEEIETKTLKKHEYYNIISKNHPLTPEQIKKKYKLKDGGTRYLIFTQSVKGKVVLRSK